MKEFPKDILTYPVGSIIDVRDKSEWDRGHLPNAIHIPYQTLMNHPEKYLADKKRAYYTYCNFGHRSGSSAEYLSTLGYNVKLIGALALYKGKLSYNK